MIAAIAGVIAAAGKVGKLSLWLNFGDNASTGTATGWNNLYAEPNPDEAAGDITSARGGAWASYGNIANSGISVRAKNFSTAATRWGLFGGGSAGTTGATTGNNSGVYPDVVMINLWFGNGSDPTLELEGFPAGKTYKITLMASRANTGDSRRTIFRVNSVNQPALQAVNNTSNVVVVTGVTPSSGVITVQLVRDDNAFVYLNAMKIEEE